MGRVKNGTLTGFCDKNGKSLEVGMYVTGPEGPGLVTEKNIKFSLRKIPLEKLATRGKCIEDYRIISKLDLKQSVNCSFTQGNCVKTNFGIGIFKSFNDTKTCANVIGWIDFKNNRVNSEWVVPLSYLSLSSSDEFNRYQRQLSDYGLRFESPCSLLKIDTKFHENDLVKCGDSIGLVKGYDTNDCNSVVMKVWVCSYGVLSNIIVKEELQRAEPIDYLRFAQTLGSKGLYWDTVNEILVNQKEDNFSDDIHSMMEKLKAKGIQGNVRIELKIPE